jgi:N-acetylglucosaminyldiphosphoundecaprenol N-acetyl-beta-D-mannosaminyltransferase
MKKDLNNINNFEKALDASGRGLTAEKKKYFFMISLMVASAIAWFIQYMIALLLFIIITLPLLILLLLRKVVIGRRIFMERTVFGKRGAPLKIKYFNFKKYYLRNAFLFFYVLTNKLQLTGLSIKEYDDSNRILGDACLYKDNPGIFNLWFLLSSSRIAHRSRNEIEMEYNFRMDFFGNLLLLIKSIPAAFFHVEARNYQPEINLFGVIFQNLTMKEAVEQLGEHIRKHEKVKVFFVNPDCFNKSFSDKRYFELLHKADYIFPDGIGVHLACKMIKNPLKENINGTDMLPFLCQMARQNNFSFYLVGGKPGIAARMKARLEEDYPGIRIAGEQHGYFDREKENAEVLAKINEQNPDIVLVAFGVPYQEKWIDENFDKINCRIAIGVGGLFDFYSGNIKRAPSWMREIGMEWFFRFLMEPRRMFNRYFIGNPVFIFRVLHWKSHHKDKEI